MPTQCFGMHRSSRPRSFGNIAGMTKDEIRSRMETRRIISNCGCGNATSSGRGRHVVAAFAAILMLTALCTTAGLAQVRTPGARPEPGPVNSPPEGQVDFLNGGVGQEQAD